MEVYVVQNNEQLAKLMALLGPKNLPGVANAIKNAANLVRKEWINGVKKANTKDGWKREYIRSIQINFQSELSAEVYADEDNMYVKFVEEGIKRFDMKPGLLNGPKARTGRNGKYNVVFFRKGTPASQHIPSMPQTVYTTIKKANKNDLMKPFKVVGIGKNIKMNAGNVKGRIHSKGSGTIKKVKPETLEGLKKIGGSGHTQYGTFRIVSKKSTGWIHPGVPEAKVFSVISKSVRPKVQKILKKGLKQDIQAGMEYLNG